MSGLSASWDKDVGVYGPVRPQTLRLSDAEQIAADRLDSVGDGSLSEALEKLSPDEPAPAASAVSDPVPDTDPASEIQDEVAAPATIPFTQSAPERSTARLPETNTSLPPAADDPTLESTGGPQFAAHRDGVPASNIAASPIAAAIVNPIDEAINLSARARAAAEALGNLQRLLEQRLTLPHPPISPTPPYDEQPIGSILPLPDLPVVHPSSVTPEMEPEASVLGPPPLDPLPERRFEVGGFLAGFALSWAIGAVLYLFMTV